MCRERERERERERDKVCLLCINVLPFTNAALISHQVKESTSAIIHQEAAVGWMCTMKEERVTEAGGDKGSNRWISEEKGEKRQRVKRDDDGCLGRGWWKEMEAWLLQRGRHDLKQEGASAKCTK